MTLVNCTNSPITLLDEDTNVLLELPITEYHPVVIEKINRELKVNDNIKINEISYDLGDVPGPYDNTLYIVSEKIAYSTDREDVMIVDNPVLDKDGILLGYKNLKIIK